MAAARGTEPRSLLDMYAVDYIRLAIEQNVQVYIDVAQALREGGGGGWHAEQQAGPHFFICPCKLACPSLCPT